MRQSSPNILCSTTNELIVKRNVDLEGIFTIHSLSLVNLQMKYSLLQPLKLDQRKCTESHKPTQKAAPPMFVPHIIVTEVQILKQHVLASSHIAQLSTPLTALESSGGNRTGLVSSTLPLIIPALRGLKRSAERWSGGKSTAVRSVCRCRSSLLAAAAEEASAAVMGSEERGRGER